MTSADTGVNSFSEHRLATHADLVPAQTAVIVVDMINEFLEDGGLMVLAAGRVLYEPIQRLVDAAHASEMPVVWLRDEHPNLDDPEFRKRTVHCLAGSWGTEIVAALHPGPEDTILPKS